MKKIHLTKSHGLIFNTLHLERIGYTFVYGLEDLACWHALTFRLEGVVSVVSLNGT